MAVTLRLSRSGRHKRPFFRIVATDSRSPREGRFLEVVGTYDPLKKEENCTIHTEKVKYWIGQGAEISDTVRTLIQKKGIFSKTS